MLARLPWTPTVPVAKPKAARINKDRRAHIVRVIAAILVAGEPTKFAFEATCRHAVRSRLCLAGWRWSDADDMAADIVAMALRRIGAQRPTWQQGQPEWAQEGFAPILRTRCVRCRSPLPEGHLKFCSQLCGGAHFDTMNRVKEAEDTAAYDLVVQRLTFWRRGDAVA
jgi:hypothetical protein